MLLTSIIVFLLMLYSYLLATLSVRSKTEASQQPNNLFFVLLIPALNEEGVIANTLDSLLALKGRFLVLVLDDASDDATVSVVARYLDDPRVRLLERRFPDARLGKGEALNAGYREVRRLRLAERYGADKVIVVVFDADGRVDPHFLHAVAPYFRDPQVAGVQSAVRMYNADRNLLTFWQNFEFVVWGELFSRSKDRLGSATLGGNGQCVRLSALDSLAPSPWRPSLTEDLDLSLRLLVDGWRMRFCPTAAVWQEALPQLRPLVRQRSRWLQGHLVSWTHLPDLMRSSLPWRTRLDLLVFMLLPTTFLPIGLASLGAWVAFLLDFGRWSFDWLLGWYFLGFGAVPLAAEAWTRQNRRALLRGILHSHLYVLYAYVWLAATVVACWNVLAGQRAWAKTTRVAREAEAPLAEKEAA